MPITLPLHRHAPVLSMALGAARRACLLAARACGQAARPLRARARRDQDRALLLAMSERELSDLGVGRGEVERISLTPSSNAGVRSET